MTTYSNCGGEDRGGLRNRGPRSMLIFFNFCFLELFWLRDNHTCQTRFDFGCAHTASPSYGLMPANARYIQSPCIYRRSDKFSGSRN